MVAVGLELMGPLIAKKVIDDHILGVEGIWHEIEEESKDTAILHGKYYKREDRLTDEDVSKDVHTILQVGTSYYMTEEEVTLQGQRTFKKGEITIERPYKSEVVAEVDYALS